MPPPPPPNLVDQLNRLKAVAQANAEANAEAARRAAVLEEDLAANPNPQIEDVDMPEAQETQAAPIAPLDTQDMSSALEEIANPPPATQAPTIPSRTLTTAEFIRQQHQIYLKRQRALSSPGSPTGGAAKFTKVGHDQTAAQAGQSASKSAQPITGDATMSDVVKAPTPPPEGLDPWLLPVNYKDIYDYRRGSNIKCSLMVEGGGKPVRNPWNFTKGWQLYLEIDGGHLANAHIKLTFVAQVGAKDKQIPDLGPMDQKKSFTVEWYPGVKVRGAYQMEGFSHFYGEDLNAKYVKRKAVYKLCPAPKDMKNLVCLTFKSKGHVMSQLPDETFFEGLDADVKANFDALITAEGTHQVVLYFVAPNNADVGHYDKHCLSYLRRFVYQQRHPLAPYLDKDGKVVLDIQTTEPIKYIGNGMFEKRLTDKEKKAGNKPSFRTLPYKGRWNTSREFHIYNGLSAVRDAQFLRGQNVALSQGTHRCYLQSFPLVKPSDLALSKTEKAAKQSAFFAYIRQQRDAEGHREESPTEGTEIVMTFDTSVAEIRPHLDPGAKERWRGTVHSAGKEALSKTGTDFCIRLTKPRGAQHRNSSPDLRFLRSGKLHMVHLEIVFNDRPVQRELDAIAMMANEDYEPQTIGPIRLALQCEPSRFDHDTTDLTEGLGASLEEKQRSREAYARVIAGSDYKDNPERWEVLNCPKYMRNKIAIIEGPPGTTKTTTAVKICRGLSASGHTIAFMATSKHAVDHAALALWDKCGHEKVIVRLETLEEEKLLMLDQESYQDLSGMNPKQAAASKFRGETLNDERIKHEFDKVTTEHVDFEARYAQLLEKLGDHKAAVDAMRKYSSPRTSGLPLGMRYRFYVWQLTCEDKRQALAEYQKRRDAITNISERAAWEQEHSVEELTLSHKYTQLVKRFIERGGNLPREERRELADERSNLNKRLMPKFDFVFMTLNNSGSEWIKESFFPTVLLIDESGQASVSLLSVPLTGFENYMGVLMLGDDKQLAPIVLSSGLNEVITNARQSVLGLLKDKGFPTFKLVVQYRMCPEIVKFVNKWIYGGKLKNAPIVERQHPIRDACRKVALKEYGIKGEKGQGSEYVMVNVAYSTARAEPDGTSLQNFANAVAVVRCVGYLLDEGVPANDITILTYYRGQVYITLSKIRETTGLSDTTRTWALDEVNVHTTDAFQGQECGVCIIDMVAASSEFEKLQLAKVEGEGIGFTNVSAHVKNANRICVALSRARYGMFVFCQVALLLSTFDPKCSQRANIAYHLAADAIERNVVHDDFETIDSHPDAIKMRARWTQQEEQEKAAKERKAQLKFIGDRIKWGRQAQRTEPLSTRAPMIAPEPAPVWKTPSGFTTRPIGPKEIVEPADQKDIDDPPQHSFSIRRNA